MRPFTTDRHTHGVVPQNLNDSETCACYKDKAGGRQNRLIMIRLVMTTGDGKMLVKVYIVRVGK